MADDIGTKNAFRLKDPADLPPVAEVKPLIESEMLLKEMAEAYLGSSPRLFELANLYLDKKNQSPAPRSTEADDPAFAVITIDETALLESYDLQAERLFGYPADEILGKDFRSLLQGGEFKQSLAFNPQDLAAATRGRRKDGSTFRLRIRTSPLNLAGRKLHTVLVHDLTEDQPFTDKQKRAEARYRTLVEQIPAVTFMASLDEQTQELYVSPQIETLLGFSPAEWISDPIRWFHQIHPEDQERMSTEFARTCIEGGSFRGEFRVLTRDKRVLWVHCEARMVRDDRGEPLFLQGVGFDITETKTAEQKVRESLREKEVLLKEIHHRVKNNLQITSSLLRLQAPRIKDKEAVAIFTDSESRIRSMALVHEKLYQSRDLARIEFAGYIRELSSYLVRAYSVSASHISLKFDLEDNYLGIDQAVPCALILNELISNSIKHGFPHGKTGQIMLRFGVRRNESPAKREYELVVQDNGVGIPAGFDNIKTSSLGLTLVYNLTKQLDGRIVLTSGQSGTQSMLTFPILVKP